MQLSFPHRETWLHNVNPGLKMIILTMMFVIVILIHNLNVMANVALAMMLLLCWTGHPWYRLMLYASPFILVFISTSTGMMMFGKGETTWYKWGLIHITEESFYRGLHLGFRSLTMAAAGLLFGLTTKPVRLFYSLMQQWKLPAKYAYSFLAAMRMIPILLDEFQTLRYAIRIRGTQQRGSRWNVYGTLKRYAIPLLAQSIRRAQRMAVAMEAKGFIDGASRTYYIQIGYSRADLWFVFYYILTLTAAYYIGVTFPYHATMVDVR
ncbi:MULTISPECIES: energy-coupling factor transporter transmembrane component T family protein [Paenibacillus]|uniref:energy-coupling factor transporter transmembrane component T family protein n=1 Tax=Paenibacillus TaxID=44249 RepID=UPI00105A9D39|nr:energy-coupling factor transporter transmembrane component T [Paenibacillus amylolyticus]MCL6664470.1 energy-coupling factor transporter transmembrane protein EcfT [Paenibacillus amylolyticus]TDL64078.1 energy-coupling factor transporter transmembrane protein EcfT [Paenibacillus amylolyticus]